MKFQAPKGTRDFFPDEQARRRYLLDAWRAVSIRQPQMLMLRFDQAIVHRQFQETVLRRSQAKMLRQFQGMTLWR